MPGAEQAIAAPAGRLGAAWRLLQPHIHRPGRIVTPDLLVTRAFVADGEPPGRWHCLALARLLTQTAVQLEPGDWHLAPALAALRSLEETYVLPALGLLRAGRLEWAVLARCAAALGDGAGPMAVGLAPGTPAPLVVPHPPVLPAPHLVLALRVGAPEPLAGRPAVVLAALASKQPLPDTRILLEPLAASEGDAGNARDASAPSVPRHLPGHAGTALGQP